MHCHIGAAVATFVGAAVATFVGAAVAKFVGVAVAKICWGGSCEICRGGSCTAAPESGVAAGSAVQLPPQPNTLPSPLSTLHSPLLLLRLSPPLSSLLSPLSSHHHAEGGGDVASRRRSKIVQIDAAAPRRERADEAVLSNWFPPIVRPGAWRACLYHRGGCIGDRPDKTPPAAPDAPPG